MSADGLSVYALHGLDIASPYEFDAPRAPAGATPDYTIRPGARRPPGGRLGPAEGRLIAELEIGDLAYWLAERADGSWLMRYRGLADFEIEGPEITAHPAPETPEGIVPILLTGGVIARILTGDGGLVLHASAVELDGRALAVLGASGMGKSTTAAYLCEAGLPLVTDDTLAVRFTDGPPRCYRGTATIRLREVARPRLGARIEEWISGSSADERLIARPPCTEHRELELAAALVLHRRDGAGEPRIERLRGNRAATGLLSNPRSLGWQDPARLREQFEAAARLADEIAVLEVSVPGERLGPGLGDELVALVTEALGG